jgi:hypothetical protein
MKNILSSLMSLNFYFLGGLLLFMVMINVELDALIVCFSTLGCFSKNWKYVKVSGELLIIVYSFESI